MAGHRHARGTGRVVTVRSQRRRDAFAQHYASAATPAEQVGAAAGYAVGLLSWLNGRQDTADAADRIVRAITSVVDDLTTAAESECR